MADSDELFSDYHSTIPSASFGGDVNEIEHNDEANSVSRLEGKGNGDKSPENEREGRHRRPRTLFTIEVIVVLEISVPSSGNNKKPHTTWTLLMIVAEPRGIVFFFFVQCFHLYPRINVA